MHYDPVLTFNVQLHGEKVWRLAPNQHVENPVDASDNHDDHAPRFARGPFPTAMPADAITLRAKPGSVVFIPRGYWHETDTFGASLALTFSLRPPTWRDAILTELRRQLERDAAWREYPMGSAAGPARRDELIARLATLLPQLRAIAGSLQADAVLEVAREP
jgi:50S ribosomal protein L16 3-hydroxylase